MIIEDLKIIKNRPSFFVYPTIPEMMECFLSGVVRGYLMTNRLTYEDYRYAKKQAIFSHGWRIRSTSPYREMQDKNIPEETIIQELLDIEIKTWEILEEKAKS